MKLMKEHRGDSILAPLFKMLEATFDLLVPLVVARIINVGIANGDQGFILRNCGLLVLMALIGLLCSFTAQFFASRAATGVSTKLRRQLYDHIHQLQILFNQTLGLFHVPRKPLQIWYIFLIHIINILSTFSIRL